MRWKGRRLPRFRRRFHASPVVSACEGQLFVHSGDDTWLLIADAFGATLHRAVDHEKERARAAIESSRDLKSKYSRAQWMAPLIDEAPAGDITSVAILPGTAAVCFSLTHQVTMIAIQQPG